jgi:DNA-binding Lrp family transcriptional regulator
VMSPLTILAGLDLSDTAKLCWTQLAHFAGARGYCWPGQRTLCELLGWSERKLRYVLRQLEDAGVLRVERRGQGRTALYHLGAVEIPVEKPADTVQMAFDFAGLDRQTGCRSIYEVSSELSTTAERSCVVELAEENPAPVSSSLVEYIRSETRFEIGGKMASDDTVRRLAAAVGDMEGWWAYRARVRAWSRRNRPESWGAFVMIAREGKLVNGTGAHVREQPKARSA